MKFTSKETESLKKYLQTEVQDKMASQVNSTNIQKRVTTYPQNITHTHTHTHTHTQIAEEGSLPNSFYKARISFVPKLDRCHTKK